MGARPNRWPVIRVAVAEESMTPALRPGDWLLAWRTGRIRPGQVVLAWHPQRPDFLLVKRVAWREARGAGGWPRTTRRRARSTAPASARCPRRSIVAVVLVRYWPIRRRQLSSGYPERAVSHEQRTPLLGRSGVLWRCGALCYSRVGGGIVLFTTDCAPTSSSISSRGSLTATAQK